MDEQFVELLTGQMESLEARLAYLTSKYAGTGEMSADIKALAGMVHNLHMLLAEEGVYNPDAEAHGVFYTEVVLA